MFSLKVLLNDLICAATCCDPRYRLLLTAAQQERGTKVVERVALHLRKQQQMNSCDSSPNRSTTEEVGIVDAEDLEDELDLLAAATFKTNGKKAKRN